MSRSRQQRHASRRPSGAPHQPASPAGRPAGRSAGPLTGRTPSLPRRGLLAGGLLLAVVALAGVLALSGPAAGPAGAAAGLPAEVGLDEAVRLREAGAFVLDVREPHEWNEYHVPGSTLVPLGELAGRLAEVPRDRDVLVVCRSGNRSQAGRDILVAAGYPSVTSMAGGLLDWRSAGHPTVTGP